MLKNSKPTMRACPDCHAPNPESRTTCYACGQSLDYIPKSAPLPGEQTYPCLNCEAKIPYRATSCPGCGRLISSPPEPPAEISSSASYAKATHDRLWGTAAASSPRADFVTKVTPTGWDAEPLPDGTVLLRRTTWGRMNTGGDVFAIVTIAAFFIFTPVLRAFTTTEKFDGPQLILLVALILAGTAALVWFLMGRQELRVGPNLFVMDYSLFGFRQTRRMTMGVFRIQFRTNYSRNGPHEERLLRVENLGVHLTLERQSVSLLSGLFADRVTELGLYLSHVTGWPLIDPANGRF